MKLMDKIDQVVKIDQLPKPAKMLVKDVFIEKGVMYGKVMVNGVKIPVRGITQDNKRLVNGKWVVEKKQSGVWVNR